MSGAVAGSDQHIQRDLTDRYRQARRAWADNAGVREAASLFGITEREYCARYVAEVSRTFPCVYTGSSSAPPPRIDPDAAYAAAGRDDKEG